MFLSDFIILYSWIFFKTFVPKYAEALQNTAVLLVLCKNMWSSFEVYQHIIVVKELIKIKYKCTLFIKKHLTNKASTLNLAKSLKLVTPHH